MLTSIISNTKWCHSVGLSCNFVRTFLFCFVWQMLLPLFVYQNLAGVTAIGFICGWCRTTCSVLWADVIAICCMWQMLLSLLILYCDWCYCHLLFVIDVIITLCYFLLIGRCYAMCCGTTLLLQEGIETCPWLVLLPFFLFC